MSVEEHEKEQEEVFRDTARLSEKIFLMQLQAALDRETEMLKPYEFLRWLHAKGHVDSMLYAANDIAYDWVRSVKEEINNLR